MTCPTISERRAPPPTPPISAVPAADQVEGVPSSKS